MMFQVFFKRMAVSPLRVSKYKTNGQCIVNENARGIFNLTITCYNLLREKHKKNHNPTKVLKSSLSHRFKKSQTTLQQFGYSKMPIQKSYLFSFLTQLSQLRETKVVSLSEGKVIIEQIVCMMQYTIRSSLEHHSK